MSNFHTNQPMPHMTPEEKLEATKSYRQRLSSFVAMPPKSLHGSNRSVIQPVFNIDRMPQLNSRDSELERRESARQMLSVMPRKVVLREDGIRPASGCGVLSYVAIGAGVLVAAYCLMKIMRN